MKVQYLGQYEIETFYKTDYPNELDYLGDDETTTGIVRILNDGTEELHDFNNFVQVKEQFYHATHCLSAFSAYAVKLDNDSAKLFYLYW